MRRLAEVELEGGVRRCHLELEAGPGRGPAVIQLDTVIYGVPEACRLLGAIDAHAELPEGERARSSPATLFQLFLLYRYHVATLDRRSFGVLGSEGQHFLRISVATAMPDLEDAMRRIAAAAGDRDGFREFLRNGRCSY
mgnify:CR=1 FL=1